MPQEPQVLIVPLVPYPDDDDDEEDHTNVPDLIVKTPLLDPQPIDTPMKETHTGKTQAVNDKPSATEQTDEQRVQGEQQGDQIERQEEHSREEETHEEPDKETSKMLEVIKSKMRKTGMLKRNMMKKPMNLAARKEMKLLSYLQHRECKELESLIEEAVLQSTLLEENKLQIDHQIEEIKSLEESNTLMVKQLKVNKESASKLQADLDRAKLNYHECNAKWIQLKAR